MVSASVVCLIDIFRAFSLESDDSFCGCERGAVCARQQWLLSDSQITYTFRPAVRCRHSTSIIHSHSPTRACPVHRLGASVALQSFVISKRWLLLLLLLLCGILRVDAEIHLCFICVLRVLGQSVPTHLLFAETNACPVESFLVIPALAKLLCK